MHFGRRSSSIFTLDPAAPTSTGFSFARLRFASRLRNCDFSLRPCPFFDRSNVRSPCPRFGLRLSLLAHALDSLVRVSRRVAWAAAIRAADIGDGARGAAVARARTQARPRLRKLASPPIPPGDWAASNVERPRPGPGRSRLTSTTVIDGRPSAPREDPGTPRRQPRVGRPRRTPARPCGFSPFGRFRGLFDSLFRVLFDFPSRYLCAIGLAIGVEPRMERTTRLRAAFSNDPTLEPTRRFDLEAHAR